MTIKNDADARSEALRRKKRRAINIHLHRAHSIDLSSFFGVGATTFDRMAEHELLHTQGDVKDHDHKDFEDWQELERMHGRQGN